MKVPPLFSKAQRVSTSVNQDMTSSDDLTSPAPSAKGEEPDPAHSVDSFTSALGPDLAGGSVGPQLNRPSSRTWSKHTAPSVSNSTVSADKSMGFSDESMIGMSNRKLLNLIDTLHTIGISGDLSLPQIVIVGAQSTGKSSLIEGISGIKLPRASGTCTRCPTEIRLKHTSPKERWRCNVTLRLHPDDGSGKLRTVQFGDEISRPEEVELRLRKAQLAILNPSRDPEDFLYENYEGQSQLTFSRDFISVDVYGPNVFDLSFYDLPGWIASAKDGHIDDVKLVNDLLEEYIEKPNCLILLTVACESDFETQGAYNLVKKFDPQGERTIGVLTKPDRIAEGDEDKWVRLVKNEDIPLVRGWFCVKQPDSNQLRAGISWSRARDLEDDYFENEAPWSNLIGDYRWNLGTKNLALYMSERLSKLIARNLPKIKDDLYDLLEDTEQQLQRMPAPVSSESLTAMINIIEAFSREVGVHVEGKPSDEHGLVQQINIKREEFKTAILSLTPKFKPYDPSEKDIRLEFTQAPPIELFDMEKEDPARSQNSLSIHIDEIMDRIKNSRTRELPGYYPYDVPRELVKESKQRWRSEVMSYFDEVQTITIGHFKKLVEATFKHYKTGGLLALVEVEVQRQFSKLRSLTIEHLDWLLQVDEKLPFTQNTKSYAENKTRFLTYYKSIRFKVTNPDIPMPYSQSIRAPGFISDALAALAKTSLRDANLTGNDLAKLIPDDRYAPAIEVMATVSAYYSVSSKRLIDDVPAAIDFDYVLGIERNIREALFQAILKQGNNPNARCTEFLQEAPELSTRRTQLKKKYERLDAARMELQNFGFTS